ncbi:MAG: GT4 family glycosyltransferase PelF [Bacteriovoracaceae bacterium]|nr:GT4 family glycosyltransferase PelF [Bacteriovoracaceae bacterium]
MSDICLFLEGTFPYVTGGVSSCVYQLIKNSPQFDFSIFYIGGGNEKYNDYKYPIPDNVKHIEEFLLFDYEVVPDVKLRSIGREIDMNLLEKLYTCTKDRRSDIFRRVFFDIVKPFDLNWDPLVILKSKEVWDMLEKLYHSYFTSGKGPSFIDFFYTWRFTHYPILRVLSANFPQAKVYHSLSTGYAGLAAAAASLQYKKPYILTEHGIYSHEREIEIYNANWIYEENLDFQAKKQLSIFKEWWIHLFHFMGEFAYDQANCITTLYRGNAERQVKYGAKEEKIEIIANGINVEHFSKLHRKRNSKFTLSMVGRVVPIKDVKTFIKAISVVLGEHSELEVLIIGPTEEDPEYYQQCVALVKFYQLEKVVTFTGKVDVSEYYPITDLCVLSSISEGQPMVILEAFACGIPVVATDVGSCRTLLFGEGEEDQALGGAGLIVPFGKAGPLGEAILKLIKDKELFEKCSDVARRRVETFYREKDNIQKYENLYQRYLEGVS